MLPTRTAIKCCRPDLQTQPNIIWLVMYLNMSATMIPRYAHKMVNVAPPKTHLPPSYCPWKFLPWSAFLRRTKGLWLPRCYRFEWTKVMVRWTEFQPPLRNSKGSYGKGAPRSEEHGGGSPGCAKRHGKLWAELSKTWTISPRRPFGVYAHQRMARLGGKPSILSPIKDSAREAAQAGRINQLGNGGSGDKGWQSFLWVALLPL